MKILISVITDVDLAIPDKGCGYQLKVINTLPYSIIVSLKSSFARFSLIDFMSNLDFLKLSNLLTQMVQ